MQAAAFISGEGGAYAPLAAVRAREALAAFQALAEPRTCVPAANSQRVVHVPALPKHSEPDDRQIIDAIHERFDLLAYARQHFPGEQLHEGDEVASPATAACCSNRKKALLVLLSGEHRRRLAPSGGLPTARHPMGPPGQGDVQGGAARGGGVRRRQPGTGQQPPRLSAGVAPRPDAEPGCRPQRAAALRPPHRRRDAGEPPAAGDPTTGQAEAAEARADQAEGRPQRDRPTPAHRAQSASPPQPWTRQAEPRRAARHRTIWPCWRPRSTHPTAARRS